ncbi:MAG: serine hydrolase domain-containing protein [Bdellovibrionia bacterium]
MKYTALENNLLSQLAPAIVDVTPGIIVRAYHAGRLICDVNAGHVYPYYDLASLTKIVFTTQAMMQAFEEAKWNLETKVQSLLNWYPHGETKILELLNHTSGLVWWMPFFQEINSELSMLERRAQLKEMLKQAPYNAERNKAVYSDAGFMILGFLLEEMYQKPLWDVWSDLKNKFYLGTTLDFHLNNQAPFKKALYAPTEECPWRKKLVQGEVHDENTWALGGVSTHAGLFGSVDDLGWYLLNLRSQLHGIARYQIRQKTTQLFVKRSITPSVGDWAIGFMMPTAGQASCGKYMSVESIGHTGFTGTSLWYDPKMDLGIIVLSNRVLYGRENKSFVALRPKIHDWLIEGFRRSGI